MNDELVPLAQTDLETFRDRTAGINESYIEGSIQQAAILAVRGRSRPESSILGGHASSHIVLDGHRSFWQSS